jgi:hypothetical protein
MQLYAIRRRNGWNSPEALKEAAARSKRIGDEEMSDDVRWIRSYIVDEGNGQLGTVCIYEATSPAAIHKHADRADLPADEISPVVDTVVIRPDPVPAAV